MAVTGHKTLCVAALVLGLFAGVARADDTAAIHQVISGVSTALSNGDAALAMSGFSKSYSDYQKLSDDFDALANAFFVESQLGFTDEAVNSDNATVSLRWDMTLTTKQSGFTKNQGADLTVKLVREGKHWRIVGFGPIEMFDPAG